MHVVIKGLKVQNKKNNMRAGKRRVYKSAEVRGYETDLRDEINAQWRGAMLEGPVKLEVNVTYPDKRRRDLHNAVDVVADVLQGICYKDDAQIHKLEMTKRFGSDWEIEIICNAYQEPITELPPALLNVFGQSPCRLY